MQTDRESPAHQTDQVTGVAAAIGGAVLVAAGRRRGGALGTLLGIAGAGLLASVLYPRTVRQLLRLGARRRVVHLRHSLLVERPVHEVFAFCQDFENFPHVFGSLRRVVDYQDGRSHWEVSTPAGRTVEWDAVVTKYVPNSVIGWASVPESPVRSSGLVRFTPTPNGGTLVDVTLDYEPRDTSLDDALHALVDVPREQRLRAELDRASFFLKSLPPSTSRQDALPVAEPRARA